MKREVFDLVVKTITPVHIGVGRKLAYGRDFFQKFKEYGRIDESKVFDIVGEEGIDIWVRHIEEGDDFLDYLERRKPGIQLNDMCKTVFPINAQERAEESREMICDFRGNPLVPGSSIKGSFRTAIWSDVVKDKIQMDDILHVGRGRNNSRGRGSKCKDKIGDQNLKKKYKFGDKFDKDIFRFIQPADIPFFKEDGAVESAMVLSYRNDEGWKRKDFVEYVETIGPDAEGRGRLTFNGKLLEENVKKNGRGAMQEGRVHSIYDLFRKSNKYYLKMIEEEIKFFEEDSGLPNDDLLDIYLDHFESLREEVKSCNENECILRIGYGTGYRFITGNKISYGDINDDDYECILRIIRKDKRGKYDDFPFIKSRKMTDAGQPFGFVKLRVEEKNTASN